MHGLSVSLLKTIWKIRRQCALFYTSTLPRLGRRWKILGGNLTRGRLVAWLSWLFPDWMEGWTKVWCWLKPGWTVVSTQTWGCSTPLVPPRSPHGLKPTLQSRPNPAAGGDTISLSSFADFSLLRKVWLERGKHSGLEEKSRSTSDEVLFKTDFYKEFNCFRMIGHNIDHLLLNVCVVDPEQLK